MSCYYSGQYIGLIQELDILGAYSSYVQFLRAHREDDNASVF
jgi:hypothetical protein